MKKFRAIALLLVATLLLSSCGTVVSVFNLEANHTIFNCGKQVVTFKITDEEKFPSNISKDDVTFRSVYTGLTCESINRISDKEVEITIGGSCEVVDGLGEIVFKDGANEYKYTNRVYEATLMASNKSSLKNGDKYSFSATYKLPLGTFTDTADKYITYDKTNGVWDFSFNADKTSVTIEVTDWTGSTGPEVVFQPECSTMGIEFKVNLRSLI